MSGGAAEEEKRKSEGRASEEPRRSLGLPGLLWYLGHVDGAGCQGLVAQDGPVLVPLAPLQHDLQLVAFSFQEVRVLTEERRRKERRYCGNRPD